MNNSSQGRQLGKTLWKFVQNVEAGGASMGLWHLSKTEL